MSLPTDCGPPSRKSWPLVPGHSAPTTGVLHIPTHPLLATEPQKVALGTRPPRLDLDNMPNSKRKGPARGKGQGLPQGKGGGPSQGKGQGPPQGKGQAPSQGKGQGPPQGKNKGPSQGKGQGPLQGKAGGPPQGKGRAPPQGKGGGPTQGKGQGPPQGKGQGPPQAKDKAWTFGKTLAHVDYDIDTNPIEGFTTRWADCGAYVQQASLVRTVHECAAARHGSKVP